ncbi:MAG TPA: TolC family protein [Polyangiaceae bacterium]
MLARAVGTLSALVFSCGCAGAEPRALSPARTEHRDYHAVHVPRVPLPKPADADVVSLDAILAYADRHAPRLRVARARRALGDAAVAEAEPLLPDNPELSLAAGPGIGGDGDRFDFEAGLSQRFEIAGERGLRLKAAERTRRRVEAELDEARWEVHRDVHAAFHRALVARERLRAAERLLGFQERLLDITERRLKAGDVSPLSVRLADGELSQSRVAEIAAEQAYLHARLELGALAGWPASGAPEPAGSLDLPQNPPAGPALLAAARRHQPRLRTLEAARVESETRVRAADRDAWPEPSLGVRVAREGAANEANATVVLGTLSLPLPLFQTNRGPRAKARAEARVVTAERAAFSSELESRIERNRTSVVAAARRVRTYGSEILPTFEESLRLLVRAFELGEIDVLQVSVARERFLRLQSDALDAYSDYFEAVAELEASVGTDLFPDEHHDAHENGTAPRTEAP